jgi:hypothetical protein
VAHALRGAARVLPPEMQSSLPGPAVEGAWERWGIHGRRLESLEYSAGRAHVIEHVSALVDHRGAAA